MTSQQHSRPGSVCRLLLLIILPPDKIPRRMLPGTPPISVHGTSGPGSRETHRLNTSNVLHVSRVSSSDQPRDQCRLERRVTINILPDDVLLHVFRFDRLSYLDRWKDDVNRWRRSWEWYRLVHVCRRWRSVVFSWPNFLDLKLVCGPGTHVEHTGIWPPLPIIIRNMVNWHMPNNYDFDAAIVHPNRVCEVNLLHLTSLQLQRLASAMERQFPALIHLKLDFDLDSDNSGPAPALPDGFLGGSAPRLRTLGLQSIPFPALPKLLLSATELVRLTLWNIPLSGYMPPEAIVTGLAVLANLKCLTIGFRSPLSFPYLESRLPLPQIRTVLPALTRFKFQGISEYLEVLVAQIDAPLLESIHCTFFQHQLDIPQLTQFMERTMLECEMNYDFLLVHVIGTRFESFDIG